LRRAMFYPDSRSRERQSLGNLVLPVLVLRREKVPPS
jgi:hypothetical protein